LRGGRRADVAACGAGVGAESALPCPAANSEASGVSGFVRFGAAAIL
jgi:hypothetical protein